MLEYHGLNGLQSKLVESYLSNMKEYVDSDNNMLDLTTGVP